MSQFFNFINFIKFYYFSFSFSLNFIQNNVNSSMKNRIKHYWKEQWILFWLFTIRWLIEFDRVDQDKRQDQIDRNGMVNILKFTNRHKLYSFYIVNGMLAEQLSISIAQYFLSIIIELIVCMCYTTMVYWPLSICSSI